MTYEVRNDVSDWSLNLLTDYTSICGDDEYLNSSLFQETPHEQLPQVNNIDNNIGEWVPFEGQMFNSDQETQHERLPQVNNTDNNIDEWVPFEGQMFNSDDDAYEFYQLFAQKNGFSIRRNRVTKSCKIVSEKNPLGIYKREFVCHRGGIVRQRKTNEVDSQRNRKSSKCNCTAKMLVSLGTMGFEEKWVVKYFNNCHNHELLDDKEVQFLPAYRNIPIADQNRILLLSKFGCSISLIMRVLELEKEIGTGNLPFLDKDVRNFIQSNSGIGKENDASDVLMLCKSLKDKDDVFNYEFTIDESNKLEHIIWAFGDSIRACEAFGDVVIFDTTYRINRYEMPLGIWVGIDNHGNSNFFGFVLLRNEKIPSFTWALKNFLALVKGKYPKTILTDQDPALKESIAMELPKTKHAFCIWHIVAKLSSWFSLPLGSKYNEFKHEFHKVYHLECAYDFEQEWKLMVAKFGLSMDKHIDLLFSFREYWALAYLKDFFFAGMTTTGRSESINSYIKRFLDVKTSLTDFVNQVGVAVQIRNQAGEEARMRQKYHNPQIKTCFPIEEHVASILTPYAFELLQHEIELSTKYAAIESDEGSYIVQHHTKVDGGRLVSWIVEEESIHCSCKEFEFSGILCRHAIRVLMVKNYFSIPSKYLPFRWRRESSLIPKCSHITNSKGGSAVKFQSLIRCLEVESSKTKEREHVVGRELEKVIQEIKRLPETQEHVIDLEDDVPNTNDCDVGNPNNSKTKGRPKGSRPKGGVEVAKKPRYCHVPNCGGTNHDSRNCPNKKKLVLPSQSPNKNMKGWR